MEIGQSVLLTVTVGHKQEQGPVTTLLLLTVVKNVKEGTQKNKTATPTPAQVTTLLLLANNYVYAIKGLVLL